MFLKLIAVKINEETEIFEFDSESGYNEFIEILEYNNIDYLTSEVEND